MSTNSFVTQPYLIQRCKIVRPLEKETVFSQAAQCDYMGSAEFEFGALPQSLRALQARADDIKLTVHKGILVEDRPIRILHTFNDEGLEQYIEYMKQLREDKIRLKERSGFGRSSSFAPDLWWDIKNHVFFSFDKIFMNRLGGHLTASWKYMDEQKAKG